MNGLFHIVFFPAENPAKQVPDLSLVSQLLCQQPPQFTRPSAELLQLFAKTLSEPNQ